LASERPRKIDVLERYDRGEVVGQATAEQHRCILTASLVSAAQTLLWLAQAFDWIAVTLTIYSLKPLFQALLRPAAEHLHADGITANQLLFPALTVLIALTIVNRVRGAVRELPA
jgi:hypothetical protein